MSGSKSTPTTEEDFVRKPNPFSAMRIDDNAFLATVPERQPCPRCHASRRFFCYTCYIPLPGVGEFPAITLPVKIDIIKHRKEIDGKSTSSHARLLAPHDCRIFIYPNIPDYTRDSPGTILIYPSHKSTTVQSLFTGVQMLDTSDNYGLPAGHNIGTLLRFRLNELRLCDDAEEEVEDKNVNGSSSSNKRRMRYTLANLPVKRAVFIDSTWNQSRSIYKDPKIRALPSVVLQHRLSQFWRHQKDSPRWYLSTVEAIHQFLLEVHVHAWGLARSYRGLDQLEIGGPFEGDSLLKDDTNDDVDVVHSADDSAATSAALLERPYSGQYDNLLFLFSHMYNLIHIYYDHNKLKAYKRPIT